ncbi:MAG: hypothetical protein ABI808_15820 [Pseudonocardiales bacterium]
MKRVILFYGTIAVFGAVAWLITSSLLVAFGVALGTFILIGVVLQARSGEPGYSEPTGRSSWDT